VNNLIRYSAPRLVLAETFLQCLALRPLQPQSFLPDIGFFSRSDRPFPLDFAKPQTLNGRLFSLDFVGDPNGCLARMRAACGGLGEEEARTQAAKFAFWASRKGRSEADEALRARFRRSLSHAITHKSSTLPKEEADRL
jgi:hypothetical protein